jgi:K(+)-stimulated pyrophosphate-energized sodium pump
MLDDPLYLTIPIAGLIGLLFAGLLTWWILKKDTGTPEMKAIGDAIREGAMAYLARQYKTIAIISIILAVLISVGIDFYLEGLSFPLTGLAFLLGAFFSALSGYIGMYVSVSSNIRTASAARRTMNEALLISFRGGAVSGIAVVALSLLGVAGIFFLYQGWLVPAAGTDDGFYEALFMGVGYAFGASFAALFAQLGGGIYTKAADVGADLVGKVEAGIPEDDPRNPAVIADLVGDNVGDCAGRGADLFESTAAENIGAMILGLAIFGLTGNTGWFMFPLVVRGFGLLVGLIGIMAVRLRNEDENPMKALNRGYFITCILAAIMFYLSVEWLLAGETVFFYCGVIGIALSIVIVYITQYYTAGEYRPVKEIAKASETGAATNIITGVSIGFETTAPSVVAIALALIGSYVLGTTAAPSESYEFIYGLYGTAAATMGMLATCAFVLAEDTFGPITDNAGGIVEMSQQPEDIRKRTDHLDAIGNTTKALTKGYAMGAAALAAYLLFGAFFEKVAEIRGIELVEFYESFTVNLMEPAVFIAALVGAMLVYLFASLAIRAVGKAAGDMISEVRRQFKERPGILEGTEKPDYATCVDISTKGALKAMVLPGILPVVVPVALGLMYRFAFQDNNDIAVMGVGALLMVGTIAGVLMALFLNNGGGAWDNAKKFIEARGMKGTPVHAAGVVGDTVGDPFKDTAGPSLHVLVKLLSTITLVFAVLFVV